MVFEDETGQSLRPPRARTWARRGHTPVVRVVGGRRGKLSVAGLVGSRPGGRSRFVYRVKAYTGRSGQRASFSWQDYRNLLIAAHHLLDAPITVVWDNLNVHKATGLQAFVAAHDDWLSVVYLPPYTPQLNPVEGIWSLLKRSMGNHAALTLDQLTTAVKHRLKKLPYRPDLIDAALQHTGLDITPA